MTRTLACVALLALAACSSGSDQSGPESGYHEREIRQIEESPVWVLEDDGSWTCVPGGTDPSVCDDVEPPGPLGEGRP